jgi:DNA-binding NtrC family response regulator
VRSAPGKGTTFLIYFPRTDAVAPPTADSAAPAAPIHLMLTDVVMPKTDGLTLAHHMAVERPDTRVLLMSGYSGDEITRHGALPAGVKLLQKPFTRASLTHLVRQALDTRDPLPSWSTEAPSEHATMR